MGNKRENKDPSNSQSSTNAIIDESAQIQKKQKASDIESKLPLFPASGGTSISVYPLGGTVASTPSATLGCTFAGAKKENLIWRNQISGYIFMCNGKTKADCYRYRVFGLPAARMNVVEKIRPCMTLFLFDFDLKLLYGVYTASSSGGLGIEPTAFGGKFLAQVKFEISKDCLPLPERVFKHAIRDNYSGGSKFRQELSNEQVTNLISLFHPISIPPVLFAKTRPAAELSASYDQYLAELKVTRFGLPSSSRYNQQAQHVPHASVAKMACELMDLQSFDPQPIISRHQCSSYIPEQNHQKCVPENIASLQKNTYNSEVGLAFHSHVAMSQTAAYWAAVASEDREDVGYCQERMPSTSTCLGDTIVPVSTVSALFTPPLQENSGRGTYHFVVAASNDLHASMPLQYQAPSYGGMYLPPSSAVKFSDNLKQVCFEPHPRLPPGSTGVEAGTVRPPYSARTSSHTSVPQRSENEVNMRTTCMYGSRYDGAVSAAEASLAGFVRVPPQTSISSYGGAHSLLAPGAAAYRNGNRYGYSHSQGASLANETSRAHCMAPLDAAAYSHYSDGAIISGIAAVAPESQN